MVNFMDNDLITSSYERQESSGAIINTDSAALARHKAQRKINERIDNLESKCTKIHNDLCEIKNLLLQGKSY